MKASLAISAVLVALGLAGYAGHIHSSLIPEDSDPEIKAGSFNHSGPEKSGMVMELRGKRFTAEGFAIQKTQNLNELRRRYGGTRHYDRILSGLDTDHYAYSADPVLRSADGATLRCSVLWREAHSPAGYCVTDEGTRMYFRFE